jgi:hypothetical protein
MINFFRKTRKKMADDNKPMKYMRYAVGEIALVVVGILIALSINNWNEERKERAILGGYLNNIKKNIDFDLVNIIEIMNNRDTISKNCRKLLELGQSDMITSEELLPLFTSGQNIFIEFYFQPDQSGFEALKNSGYLGRINGTELENKLYQYNYLVKKIAEQEKSMNDFIESMEVTINRDNTAQSIVSILQNARHDPNYIRNNTEKVKEFLNHPSFTGAVIRGTLIDFLLQFYEELISIGNDINAEIDHFTNDN